MILNNDTDKLMAKIRRERKWCLFLDILSAISFVVVAVWVYTIRGCKWDTAFIIIACVAFAVLAFFVFRREIAIFRELKWYDDFDEKQIDE